MKGILIPAAVAFAAGACLISIPASSGQFPFEAGFGIPLGPTLHRSVGPRDFVLNGDRRDSEHARAHAVAIDGARSAMARMDDDEDDDEDEEDAEDRREAAAARHRQRKAARAKSKAAAAAALRQKQAAAKTERKQESKPEQPVPSAAPKTAAVTSPNAARVATPGPASKAARPSGACKRFVPTAGVTVSVPCATDDL